MLTESNELLKVENLQKHYVLQTFPHKKILKAVDGLSFMVNNGEVVSIVGESGCGKTTLAKLILKIEEPSAGCIFFAGSNIYSLKSRANQKKYWQKVKIVFQDPYSSLNPRWSIGKTLSEPLLMANNMKRSLIKKYIAEKLPEIGLSPKDMRKYPHEFSGGQRQRIAILRAVINNPELVVCDEPTSALDVSIRAQIINLLINLQKKYNLTYIFISHDLSIVNYISDRILVMYLGKIMEILPADNIFDVARHPYTRTLIDAMPDICEEKLKKPLNFTENIVLNNDEIEGCVFRTRCNFVRKECEEVNMDLIKIDEGHFSSCPFFL
jgi:oligopeptide/dipeptide ABC transporter ATP-binding protein